MGDSSLESQVELTDMSYGKEVFFTLPRGLQQSEIDCDPDDISSFKSCDDYLATVMLERERLSIEEQERLSKSPKKQKQLKKQSPTKSNLIPENNISDKLNISSERVKGINSSVDRCIIHINSLKVIPASDEEMADILSDRNVAHTDPQELLQELEKLEN